MTGDSEINKVIFASLLQAGFEGEGREGIEVIRSSASTAKHGGA